MPSIDLRDQIEVHCNSCSHLDSRMCDDCFFATVELSTPTLGGAEIYNRAFRYLRRQRIRGYKRDKPFGNYLNIPVILERKGETKCFCG